MQCSRPMTLVRDPLDLQSVPHSALIIWVLYQPVSLGWGGVGQQSSLATPSLYLRSLQRLRGPIAGVACDSGKRPQVKAAHPKSSDSYQDSAKPVGKSPRKLPVSPGPSLSCSVVYMRLLRLKQQAGTVTQVSQGPPCFLCSPLSLSASQLEVTLRILPGLLTCFE